MFVRAFVAAAVLAAATVGAAAPAQAGRFGPWQTCVPEVAFDQVKIGATHAQVRDVFGGPGHRAEGGWITYRACLIRGTTGAVLLRYEDGRLWQAWWIEL